MAQLKHPNIIQIYAVNSNEKYVRFDGTEEKCTFLTLELA